MVNAALVVFAIVAALGAANAGDEPESLFSEAMRHMGTCSETINIEMGTCMKMLDDDTDRSDAKFDSCKAMGVCMSEKFGVMVGNDYDFAKMKVHADRIKDEGHKAEAENIIKECGGTSVGPNQGETLINIATCMLKVSPKWKGLILDIAKSMSSDDDK